jgi:hypothetical protein
MNPIALLFQSAIKPIANAYSARQARKQASTTGKQKIQKAQVDADNTLNLSDAEWEAINASKQDSTYKDEYLTVVCTSPFLLILAGAILVAFGGSPALLEGTVEGIKAINNLDGNVADMMKTVVFAGVGIKLWRSR